MSPKGSTTVHRPVTGEVPVTPDRRNPVNRFLTKEVTQRRWQQLIVWVPLTLLWILGILGARTYVQDRNEIQDRQREADKYASCVQRVNTRADLRGVLGSLVDEFATDPTANARGHGAIDRGYPELFIKDCGTDPLGRPSIPSNSGLSQPTGG
jgi:hypothetical protein